MSSIETRNLAQAAAEVAPDGLQIRRLLPLRGGSCAHCRLHAGEPSHPVHDAAVARRLGGGACRGPLAGVMIRCWWSIPPAWLLAGTRA